MRYIGFLRAINVGGRVVKMDRLRDILSAAGLAEVETFIASGNVIFQGGRASRASLERRIEDALRESLKWEVATFLRTPAEVVELAVANPFGQEGHALYVGFLAAPPPEEARLRLSALGGPEDEFRVEGSEFWWLTRRKISDSKITPAKLERALGGPTTMRNVTTIRRLAKLYG